MINDTVLYKLPLIFNELVWEKTNLKINNVIKSNLNIVVVRFNLLNE